jgi:hypothetical protein
VAAIVYADLTNRLLVASSKGVSQKPLASPFHQDKLYLSIQPLEINPSGALTSDPYTTLDGAGFSLSVLVTTTTGTTLAGPQTSWAVDGQAKIGSIDLNTAAMVTAFTSGSTLYVDAYIYFQFDDGSNRKVTIKSDLRILRSYLTSGTPSELPLETYLTRDECLALFVKWSGNAPGAAITLVDSTDTYETIIKCNDDGSNSSNAVA